MATDEFSVTKEFDISVDINSSKGFVGDLNADGYPDIALSITQSGVKKLAVYTGGSGGALSLSQILSPGGIRANDVLAADLDNDGDLDLVTPDGFSGKLYWFKNSAGTFSSGIEIASIGVPVTQITAFHIALGDFDQNGSLDLLVSGYSNSQTRIFLLNDANLIGTLAPSSGGAWTRGVAIGDFNSDGYLDSAVTNVNSQNLVIRYGPSFTQGPTYTTGAYPIGAVAADFDGDGDTDIATADYAGKSISLFYNTSGVFTRTNVSVPGNPSDVILTHDIDQDGRSELLFVYSEGPYGIGILSADGPANNTLETIALESNHYSLSVGDFDSDGASDIIVGSADEQSIKVLSLATPEPTYSVVSSVGSVNEGDSVTFSLSTTNVSPGTAVPYTLSGVSSADITGPLSGTFSIGANGQAVISVSIVPDASTEGPETLTLSVMGRSASTVINDTSVTLNPSYEISSSAISVNEGSIASFTLSTTNVSPGTTLSYSISGVSLSDIGTQSLNGSATLDSNGRATITVPITADSLTEGTETLTVSVQGQSASVTIVDTSLSPTPTPPATASYTLTARDASVTEGSNAVFNLSTTNVDPGTAVRYILSGVGESDVTGGTLAGTVTIGMDGTAIITVSIREDQETEGLENLYVYVQEESARTSIIDTSKAPVSTGSINITIYDYSYTNDQSIRQTNIGNLVLFEGADSSDIIKGTTGNDRLLGYGGDDRFYSTVGDDVFDGGDGLDAITFIGGYQNFAITKSSTGWTVRDSSSETNEGTDTLTGVERLGFADKAIALDIDGNAGKAYRVYKAAFARDPMQGDTGGLGYWIDAIDQGMDMVEVGARFIDSEEFRGLYGNDPQDEEFLYSVYRNVLGREPDSGGLAWWLNEMRTNPEKTYAKILADFAESAENVVGTAQLVGQGIVYDPWDSGGGGGGGGGG